MVDLTGDEHLKDDERWARRLLEGTVGQTRVTDRKGGTEGRHDLEAVLPDGRIAALEITSDKPITLDLAETVGKPPTHAPTEPPTPRYVDVLMHGLRRLRFLLDNDATNAAAMSEIWRRHLAPLEPALAGMYDEQHQAVG